MRVAVFGATGLVGSSVVTALRFDPDKRVDAVIGLSRLPPSDPQPHVEWRQVDLDGDSDGDELAAHLQGVDAVVSAAWQWPGGGRGADNVARVRRLLDAVARAGTRHLVHASSFAVYSPVSALHDPIDEGWPTEGLADVGFVREQVALERLFEAFATEHEVVRVVRIRSGVALGPRSFTQLTGKLGPFSSYVRPPSRLPVLPGIAGAALPAVHHDDLAAAFRLSVTGSASGPFNIALDTPLDLTSAARALGARPVPVPAGALAKGAALADRVLPGRSLSGWFSIASGAPRLDTTRARHELGWEPVRSLDDALRDTFARQSA